MSCGYCSGSRYHLQHPFWLDERMCRNCADRLPRCASCDRKVSDSNNTSVCSRCLTLESVRSFPQVRSAFEAATQFFQHIFSYDIAKTLRDRHPGIDYTKSPLLLSALDDELRTEAYPVDVQALPANLLQGSVCYNGNWSTAGRTDLHISKRSKRRYVKGIYVLIGLPYALFLAHLCHELMHAALFLSHLEGGSRNFTHSDEEALCTAVSLLALDHIRSAGGLHDDEFTLIKFAKYQWSTSQKVTRIYNRMSKAQNFSSLSHLLDIVLDPPTFRTKLNLQMRSTASVRSAMLSTRTVF